MTRKVRDHWNDAVRPFPIIAQVCALVLMTSLVVAAALSPNRPSPATAASHGHAGAWNHGRCFPAKQWNAPHTRMPCASIVRVYEDGSVAVRVSDHVGTTRYTFSVGARDR